MIEHLPAGLQLGQQRAVAAPLQASPLQLQPGSDAGVREGGRKAPKRCLAGHEEAASHVAELIAATTTSAGLRVEADIDDGHYPLGQKVIYCRARSHPTAKTRLVTEAAHRRAPAR